MSDKVIDINKGLSIDSDMYVSNWLDVKKKLDSYILSKDDIELCFIDLIDEGILTVKSISTNYFVRQSLVIKDDVKYAGLYTGTISYVTVELYGDKTGDYIDYRDGHFSKILNEVYFNSKSLNKEVFRYSYNSDNYRYKVIDGLNCDIFDIWSKVVWDPKLIKL